ncbi:MAG: hypothetical protein DWQ05_05140 [Calditrichaeota bacterium]|nr:MAG: hypothetical protein DWQ05_05140 [Calditrichota bacterium]
MQKYATRYDKCSGAERKSVNILLFAYQIICDKIDLKSRNHLQRKQYPFLEHTAYIYCIYRLYNPY